MRFAVLLLLAVGALSSGAHRSEASTLEHIRAVNGTMDWNASYVPASQRRRLAASLESYWQSFLDRVPRLSPQNLGWVKAEMASHSAERVAAIVSTREFSLWFLADKAEYCRNYYRRIAAEQRISERYEGLLWARSQACYRNSAETVAHLERAGLSERYDGAFNVSMFRIWEAWTIDVLVGSALDPPDRP